MCVYAGMMQAKAYKAILRSFSTIYESTLRLPSIVKVTKALRKKVLKKKSF